MSYVTRVPLSSTLANRAATFRAGSLTHDPDSVACSKYDGAYPLKMQSFIKAPFFKHIACTGAVTKDMMEKQDPQTNYGQDLITISAGGNDVGFSDVLKACIFLPQGLDKCNAALDTAEKKIDTELGNNVQKLLYLFNWKTAPNGIILYQLYAKFFDESPTPCNDEKWCFTLTDSTLQSCLTVNVDLRKRFNDLVGKTNKKLVATIKEFNKGQRKVYYAHWGAAVVATGAQFCEKDSGKAYDDASNYKLAFIRPNIPTHGFVPNSKVAIANQTEIDAHYQLKVSLPDSIMRNFHPNDLGTWYQASTALNVLAQARREQLGTAGPADTEMCDYTGKQYEPRPQGVCTDSSAAPTCYIKRDGMMAAADKFCKEHIDGKSPSDFDGKVIPYGEKTLDAVQLRVRSKVKVSYDTCKAQFTRIIDGCQISGPNPLNWKYGGSYDEDYEAEDASTKYDISIPPNSRSCKRPHGDKYEPLQAIKGQCDSFYQGTQDEFWIYGAGWAQGDAGIEIFNQMSHCIGSSVTNWSFEYYDKPNDKGMEWVAFGHTPIWQKNCFSPVIKGAGGPDIPCNGLG